MNKRILKIASLTMTLIIVMMSVVYPALAATLRKGDRNADVKKVQQRLKDWGYYKGAVDGIFGSQTRTAVRNFQKKNKLKVDGIVGSATAKALGITLNNSTGGTDSKTSADVLLLAQCISGEARGEPYLGQVAVGAVILNRVRNSEFPNSISGVIYQKGAFDAVADGQINMSPTDSALRAAKDAMNGNDPTQGCIFYYNPVTATNKWIRSRPIMLTIGQHVFCK